MTLRQVIVLGCALLLSACGPQPQEEGASGDRATVETTGVPDTDAQGSVAPGAPDRATPAAPPAAFAVCRSCHAVTPGRHGAGPSLAGIWGQKAASIPGYPYSAALRSSGIVWNAETLDTWLEAPTRMVPGTRMIIGIPNPEARKAVIDYLETLQ